MNSTLATRGRVVHSVTIASTTLARLLPVLVQLVLVLLLIQQYQIESRTFFQISVLTVAGFVVHSLLPLAYRLPFFVALSVAGIGIAFGLLDGAWLLAFGLVLIGICHLPIAFAYRIALLLGVGGLFALWRAEVLPGLWSVSIWPILASMFMFRLALYLHALRHDPEPPRLTRTLAYFFMLPNVCFPLFPVVDYGTFSRTYYDREESEIYERGADWIVRGLIHLLLYRFIYQHLTVDPTDMAGLGDVVQFVLSTFGLYLRVSGQFHLIVGMLHLFGFRLPETHRLYYLASSFTDFWRRINIYWKDFMMKLVYYPSFFRLRRWGDRTAMVGATAIVFLSTWILHSYQWFWLRGGFPVTLQDGLFWGILGAFVVVNSLRELRRGRKRTLKQEQGWNVRVGLRTAVMFWTMAMLWSLWSSESVGDWIGMWAVAANVDIKGVALLIVVTAGFVLAGSRDWNVRKGTASPKAGMLLGRPATNVAVMAGLILVAQPTAQARMLPEMSTALASMQSSTLNARDADLQHKGYYEQLDNASRMSAELWALEEQRPEEWLRVDETGAERRRTDFLQRDMYPDTSVNAFGALMTTNSFGMRDQEYAVAKPAGVFRIAVLGPSHVKGTGVADGETFEAVLEEHLNGHRGSEEIRYEVLNFGVGGYSLLQQLAMLDDRVLDFEPDAVILTSSPNIGQPVVSHLRWVLEARPEIPYEELESILETAGAMEYGAEGLPIPSRAVRDGLTSIGIDTRAPWWETRTQLQDAMDEIVAWTLDETSERIRSIDAVPIFLGLDVVREPPAGEWPTFAVAESAGFITLDLFDVYDGRDPTTLRIAPFDNHPNALGHQLIAARLFGDLVTRADELGLGTFDTSAIHLPGEKQNP
jgi:D-alanyl-lipoteichoic acid acyltransferase DltB (MBOAT superfamily)